MELSTGLYYNDINRVRAIINKLKTDMLNKYLYVKKRLHNYVINSELCKKIVQLQGYANNSILFSFGQINALLLL